MHNRKIQLLVFSVVCISMFIAACTISEQDQNLPTEDTSKPGLNIPTPDDASEDALASLSDEEATELMYTLTSGPNYQEAIEIVLAAKDIRFVAVLIELMRANQIGLLTGAGYIVHINALETLSGESFGDNWAAWIEWYGSTSLTPPPGFTSWKGTLLGGIDPGFEEFLRDEFPTRIRVEEILWGGVRVDGIPALDNPTMIPAEDVTYLEFDEPVFGISINGDHRAYPLRIMDWHEMANDVVGGVPVSLAYCTLCGAGIAYDGRTSNGETYTFGSSGFLFRSNKLMYDRQTRTLWNQLTGEPVLGELVVKDIQLDLVPVVVTSWEAWLVQHPDTLVLDLNTGYQRPYLPGAAYGTYFASEDTMFPVWQRSDLLDTKDRIYALQVDGIPKAYPIDILAQEQVVNDRIAMTNIVIVARQQDLTVRVDEQITYNAGSEVRVYNRIDWHFKPSSNLDSLVDSTGRSWQITEEALVGPEGELAPRVQGHLAYWFGWYSFFPNTLLYGSDEQ